MDQTLLHIIFKIKGNHTAKIYKKSDFLYNFGNI